ncbi:MAG: sugar ABC transporter permease [Verrucomicrobia bacterium]|nr:sugar ABC transporter permease [Verrucomicrobiota bacterium]MBV8378038.1 sugar ABC transporter permease [Verrucomicrobiota bacterium]
MDDQPRLSLDGVQPSSGRGLGGSALQRRGQTYWSRSRKEALAAWLFILPDFIGLLIFVAVPMVLSLSLGFFSVNGFGGYKFIGLANYSRMFHDPLFLESIEVTIIYVVVLVPGLYVTGLGLALLVQQKIPFIGLWRSLFFMPYVVSLVVIALIWKVLLIEKVGFLNQMLALVGLQGQAWLGDPKFALGAVLAVTIWFLMGYYMIIFLSGLQEIPREYYEAARIDGANAWTMFINITLPLLRPTSFFVILVSTVAAVSGSSSFDLIYVMTNGGPANSTSLAVFYIYEQAFKFNDYGYAAAMASTVVVILLAITVVLFALTRGGRFHLA